MFAFASNFLHLLSVRVQIGLYLSLCSSSLSNQPEIVHTLSVVNLILCKCSSLLKRIASIVNLIWVHGTKLVHERFTSLNVIWFILNISSYTQQNVHMLLDIIDRHRETGWARFVFCVCFQLCHDSVISFMDQRLRSIGSLRLVIQSHTLELLCEKLARSGWWCSSVLYRTHYDTSFRAPENVSWCHCVSRLKWDAQSVR